MEQAPSQLKELRVIFGIILVALVLVFVVLCLFVIRDYERAKALDAAEMLQSSLEIQRHSGPLSKTEIGDISGWMTFDYVNYLFELPAGYLKMTVPINDTAYPYLSLNTYARHSGLTKTAVTTAVQSAVAAYLK